MGQPQFLLRTLLDDAHTSPASHRLAFDPAALATRLLVVPPWAAGLQFYVAIELATQIIESPHGRHHPAFDTAKLCVLAGTACYRFTCSRR